MQNKEIKQLINKNMNVTKTINCHNNQEVIQAPIGDTSHMNPPDRRPPDSDPLL